MNRFSVLAVLFLVGSMSFCQAANTPGRTYLALQTSLNIGWKLSFLKVAGLSPQSS